MTKESALRMAEIRRTNQSIHRQVCDLQKDGDASLANGDPAASAEPITAMRLVAASAMPDMEGRVLISIEAFQAISAAIAKVEDSPQDDLLRACNNARIELSALYGEYMNTRVGACPSATTIQECRAAIAKAEGYIKQKG